MKQKLSNLQVTIFTAILCAVVVLGIFVAMKMTVGKTLKEVQIENETLQQQYDVLAVYIAEMPTYEKQITEYAKKIDKNINKFNAKAEPAYVLHDYTEVEDEQNQS